MKKGEKNRKKFGLKNTILCVIVSLIISGLVIFTITTYQKNNNTGGKKNNIVDNKKNDEEIKKVSIIDVNSKSRPYAVMINTHNASLPQVGLQDAYIVYELMVEGGITRMMALFKDKDISKIGSVRSARTQYLGYVYENDAIYVHAGGAKDAKNRISNEKISAVDVDGKYGIRDKNLNRAWEHTLFTSTELINNAIKNNNIRIESNVDNLFDYQAISLDLSKYESKIVANDISVNYSDYRTSEYSYDEEEKVYLRSMNGNKHIDLITEEQYEFKNIIIYDVVYSNYSYGKKTGYQKLSNIGSGEGYYVTEGYAIPIVWEKSSEKEQTKYKIKETNEELILNDGNTFIQIYPKGRTCTIK